MTDDRNNDQSGAGFDDWLDDEPGPVTDPYKTLAADDVEDAATEDVATEDAAASEKTDDGGGSTGEPDASSLGSDPESSDDEVREDPDAVREETIEMDAAVEDGDSTGDDGDETAEIDAVAVDSSPTSVDDDETTEIEAVASDHQPPADPESSVGGSVAEDPDDTGDLEVVPSGAETSPKSSEQSSDDESAEEQGSVAAVGFGELWDGADDQDAGSSSAGSSPEFFDMTQEDYLHTATKEHEGLAESIAMADDEDTEQVALAAPIPGLDPTVVGFEDVVEAEGYGKVRAAGSSDLVARVITAIVLIAALGAALLWQPALVALALGVFLLGAGEFYTSLVRSGRKPIALFGFAGIVTASLGAYFGSALWIPLAFALLVTALLLFYAVVPGKADPLANLALTTTVMVWVGLGSFAMLIAKSDSYRTLVLGVVITVAAMDIAQYFFGRALGKHKLSPWVSPKKTIEGLVAGIVVAMVIGALLHFFPPFEMTSGLAIGAAVAVFAPLGDLAMSAAKRSLGLKDMGSVLPGHGGVLDRVDGLLFVIPVAWAIFVRAGIL
jgi:phosphatidate cytidylyltransferase